MRSSSYSLRSAAAAEQARAPNSARNDVPTPPENVVDCGGSGDNNTTTPRTEPVPAPSSCSASQRVQFKGEQIDAHLDRLLECPVCYDLILPPIISCGQGHNCCNSCRQSVDKCPVCRGDFIGFRNLFAEQLLEQCQFQCKHGCNACLPAKELSLHYQSDCCFRPIHCRECDRLIPYDDFLQHVELVDKLERQQASECSTGFEIDEEDLASHPTSPMERRFTVWEPTWMNCYGQDFFCSLDFNGEHWWIWVASMTETGCRMKCQVILWSKQKCSEHTYFGSVHSIRAKPDAVLQSGECLILTKIALKNFMDQGGIDVLVRIEPKYVVPKTRRGVDVQSPLEIMNPISPSQSRPHWSRVGRGQNGRDFNLTPNRVARAAALRHAESRIPVSVTVSASFLPTPETASIVPGSVSGEDSVDELSAASSTNTVRRVLFDNIPSRGAGSSGTASDMRYRIGRGYRHAQQRPPTRSVDVEAIDLTIHEE